MAGLTRWIGPPLQGVSGVCERSYGDAIAGDLRIGADVDQGRPSLDCPPGLSRVEPSQAARYICQQLLDRGPCHGARAR